MVVDNQEKFLEEIENLFMTKLDKCFRSLSGFLEPTDYYKVVMQQIDSAESIKAAVKDLLSRYEITVKQNSSKKKAA